MTRHRALVWQSLLERHRTVDRSALVTANVQAKWRVLIVNVETHVLDLATLWLIVSLLIMYPPARVASVTRAIRLFNARSCLVSLRTLSIFFL